MKTLRIGETPRPGGAAAQGQKDGKARAAGVEEK